jgi:hypothetical protein
MERRSVRPLTGWPEVSRSLRTITLLAFRMMKAALSLSAYGSATDPTRFHKASVPMFTVPWVPRVVPVPVGPVTPVPASRSRPRGSVVPAPLIKSSP